MIRSVSPEEIETLILKDHPHWNRAAVRRKAQVYKDSIDDRLDEPLRILIQENRMADIQYGEFSLYHIRALRHNCSYFQAILLMDAYMKNQQDGKALIFRR